MPAPFPSERQVRRERFQTRHSVHLFARFCVAPAELDSNTTRDDKHGRSSGVRRAATSVAFGLCKRDRTAIGAVGHSAPSKTDAKDRGCCQGTFGQEVSCPAGIESLRKQVRVADRSKPKVRLEGNHGDQKNPNPESPLSRLMPEFPDQKSPERRGKQRLEHAIERGKVWRLGDAVDILNCNHCEGGDG